MPTIDFSHLSVQERIDLIEALCDSLDSDAVPITPAQAEEIDRRLAMLDADPTNGRDAFEALADFRRRFL